MEHKEKQEIKWADVAHYYSQSSIKGFLNWGPNANKKIGKPFTCTLALQIVDGMATGRLVFTPILRALEDMSQDEADEYLGLFTTYQSFIGKPSAVTLALESINNRLWRMGDVAAVIHWLISHGFDVFGLIKSGQAIRKEVQSAWASTNASAHIPRN